MKQKVKKHNFLKKSFNCLLIGIYLFTIGHLGEVLAELGSSTSYTLERGVFSEGGSSKASTSYDMETDSVGQSIIGRGESASYTLKSGFVYTLCLNPPELLSNIGNFSWDENTSLNNAFDLDDYFEGESDLTYAVYQNNNINVDIDPVTHEVSFSQAQAWFGTEQILFVATDTDSNTTESNEITLQVQGVDNAPVLDYIPDIALDELELVTIAPNATDIDNDPVTYTFSAPLDTNGEWQTDYTSAGIYIVTVTAEDTIGLTDTQDVQVTVRNVNRAPILDPIADITVNETELVDLASKVNATDPDNETLDIYYSSPVETDGTWLTNYDSEGDYVVIVTVSDGIDTVSQNVNIRVNNTNRAPIVDFSLSKYTVVPEGKTTITVNALDPDNDSLIYTIKKDEDIISTGELDGSFNMDTTFSEIGDYTISVEVIDLNLDAITVIETGCVIIHSL